MRYSEKEMQALRDRWRKPLVNPETGNEFLEDGETRFSAEGCKTFKELLKKRLNDIGAVLLPEINKVDENLSWARKREKYQEIWLQYADDIFQLAMEEIENYGLEDKLQKTIEEQLLNRRKVSFDLRGANLQYTHFEGAFLILARFDGAICIGTRFDCANCWDTDFSGTNCRLAHFDGVDCTKAHFDDAKCWGAHFEDADCSDAHFEGAECNYANFEDVICDRAKFIETVLTQADFTDSICGATWFTDAKCQFAIFEGADCQCAQFDGTNLMGADFTEAMLNHSYIKDAEIDTVTKFDTVIKEERKPGKSDTPGSLVETYNQLKQLQKTHGYYGRAGDFYFREMHCRRMALPKEKYGKRLWEWFKEEALGYGEKPWNMLKVIGITIGTFAFFPYFFWNCIQNTGGACTQWDILKSLYFSTVTFVTLGYGDFAPINNCARIVTSIEGLLGVVFVALFVVALGRKIIRD